MTIDTKSLWLRSAVLLAILSLAAPAAAVDGVIGINQTRALAGGVTSNDDPGFPVSISRPGSYRLTSNLATGSRALTAIEVTTSDVTIDLNGFTIACTFATRGGPISCLSGTGDGDGVAVILSHPFDPRITVKNGIVVGMGRYGVLVGPHSRVENVTAAHNGQTGISAGEHSVVTGCTAQDNGSNGIFGGSGSSVIGNTSANNQQHGFYIGRGSAASDNTARSNGLNGFRLTGNSTVSRNTSFDNGEVGFDFQSPGSSVVGNSASNNNNLGMRFLQTGLGNVSGYKDNVLFNNNGGNANTQVGGGIQMGTNICGNAACP